MGSFFHLRRFLLSYLTEKMKKILIIISLALVAFSCKKVRLDGLGFPAVELDSYEYENYEDPELTVPDSMLQGLTYIEIELESYSSETEETYNIYGVYLGDTATIDQDTVIYFCHGQSRHNDFYFSRAALWAHLNGKHHYGVFMIDYRGYGKSEGKSSEKGLSEDADAGIDWLITQGAQQERTFFYGYSLGAIPLIERTAYRQDFKPAKLICEAPLASVKNLTQNSTLLNTDEDFVTDLEFNNAETIKEVQVPFFWLHGTADDYIDISNGELIYANYQGPYKQSLRVEDGRHADIPEVYGYEAYLQEIKSFIEQ